MAWWHCSALGNRTLQMCRFPLFHWFLAKVCWFVIFHPFCGLFKKTEYEWFEGLNQPVEPGFNAKCFVIFLVCFHKLSCVPGLVRRCKCNISNVLISTSLVLFVSKAWEDKGCQLLCIGGFGTLPVLPLVKIHIENWLPSLLHVFWDPKITPTSLMTMMMTMMVMRTRRV